jgi:hypothetical protein
METQQEISVLVIEHCCRCGTPFGMENSLYHDLQKHGRSFYCPNGHSMTYGRSIEDELKAARRDLKATEENCQWWKNEAEVKAAQLKTTRTQLTKTKNRIAKGICPCCHRQFVDLQNHMGTKHPDYAKAEGNQP